MEREYRIAVLNRLLVSYRHQVAELEEYIRFLYSRDFTNQFDADGLRTVYEIQRSICERRIEEIENRKLELGDDLEE